MNCQIRVAQRVAVSKSLPKWMLAPCLLMCASVSVAAPVIRQGSGANPSALQSIVDLFRADLGGVNNGVGNSFTSGRREINWDGVPDNFAAPNDLPNDFFNNDSPRGVVFHTVLEDAASALNRFAVSSSTASGVALRFGDINPSYTSTFQAFSEERLFVARGAHATLVRFYKPGTNLQATVKGLGVVFADVDSSSGGGRSLITFYGPDGNQLPGAASAPALNGGLSFIGVSYNAGERIAYAIIRHGTHAPTSTNTDGANGVDAVVMDDFIYGEPQPVTGCIFHDSFECPIP
jgi:hypothetical protein